MGLEKPHEDLVINGTTTSPSSLSMAAVVREFGGSYLRRFGQAVPAEHLRAILAIEGCRTVAMGGHVVKCPDCELKDYAYHSCRNRACPRCMQDDGAKWLEERRQELLPVPYFHVVFMLPGSLYGIVRRHQRALYPVLMKAAAQALGVAGDPRYFGGELAVMTTLHTWSKTLIYHPHVHCLLPSGAVDAQGQWRSSGPARFPSSSELADAFRQALLRTMSSAVKGLVLPPRVFRQRWQVYIDQPAHGVEALLRYLGRPLHRGPLSDYDIVSVTPTEVEFRYRTTGGGSRTMKLTGHEFLRRFLQHVWPSGKHKVRYFGLWTRRRREEYAELRGRLLAQAATPPAVPPLAAVVPAQGAAPATPTVPHWLTCPRCQGQMVIIERFRRGAKLPPLTRPVLMRCSPPAAPP